MWQKMLLHRLLKIQTSYTRRLKKENTKKFRRERLIPSSRLKTRCTNLRHMRRSLLYDRFEQFACLLIYIEKRRMKERGECVRLADSSFLFQIEGCMSSNGFKGPPSSNTHCGRLSLFWISLLSKRVIWLAERTQPLRKGRHLVMYSSASND